MKTESLAKSLGGKKIKCLACSHYCQILPGKTGICGVRQNINGQLKLLVYGRAIAAHIDPIEKKPLFHFLPGEPVFSIGTIGCNFGCDFCQNWDISQASKQIKKQTKEDQEAIVLGEIMEMGQDLPPARIVEYCKQQAVNIIAYTYNEPTIFFEYAFDTARLAASRGMKNAFVSNGYMSKEALEKIQPYLDGINVDLKSFSDDFYRQTCRAKLGPVLKNIERIYKMGIWIEVTTLLIPDKNSSKNELKKIAEFIVSVSPDIPWHVSAFYPTFKMTDVQPTSLDLLINAHDIGKKAGLNYIYTGNIPNSNYESTICPKCDNMVVERRGYSIGAVNLDKGKCAKCGLEIPGVWR